MSPPRRRWHLAVPWLVLVLALAPTIYAWRRAARTAEARAIERFHAETEATWTSLSRSTLGYVNALRSLQAMFHASGEVSPAAWKTLLGGLEWRKRFPSFIDIGYADAPTADAASVRYVDAWRDTPTHAPGSDLAAHPEQHIAMEQARDTRIIAATPEIALPGVAVVPPPRGVVVFVPVWRSGEKPPDAEAARADLRGFVFASLDPAVLYSERAEASAQRMLDVKFAGAIPRGVEPPPARDFERVLAVPGVGQQWFFRCTPGPGFATALPNERPQSILIGGGAISVLLFGLAWNQARRRSEVEARVAERTGELTVANENLQRAESDLRDALAHERELHELKTNFVNLVSHEFRTPLGIILASAEMLDRYLDRLAPDERREHLRDIQNSTRHMTGLMEEVLLLGRAEAGRMQCAPAPLDLAEFCAEIADELRSVTGGVCPIELSTGALDAPARADASLLRHIFTNLLSNAVKYSPPGSPVEFSIRRASGDAVFEVRDRGLGIPAEELPHLFTAFRRARNVSHIAGSGLGLVIVKRCVELHGGEVSIESHAGTGTTARVRLPLFPA